MKDITVLAQTESQVRNLAKVITRILKKIPDRRHELRHILEENLDCIIGTDPEETIKHWHDVGSTLRHYLGDPLPVGYVGWRKDVFDIWMNRV